MNYILHGDNHVASRNQLHQLVIDAKQAGIKDVVRLDGLALTLTDLRQALESTSLFGSDRLIIIENLLSRLTSKEKKQLTDYLIKSLSQESNLILWEKASLRSTQTAKLKNFTVKEFKTPSIMFHFLDSLRPNLPTPARNDYLKICTQTAPELLFYMLARQIRLLLQVADPNTSFPPWQKNKLLSQAKVFGGEKKLLDIHQHLLEIDERIKTGQSGLGLQGELDLLMTKL